MVTGLPKAIVHCHGGILLEHLKNHGFSWDLHPGDRLQWFTTTAWMMWNALVSVLLLRASIVMIDGNPSYPDSSFQWRVLEETRPTFFGLSPAFTMACRKEGLEPGRQDPRQVRGQSAAGHVGVGVYLDRRRQREAVLRVDPGRGEQHLPERLAELGGRVELQSGHREQHVAGQ